MDNFEEIELDFEILGIDDYDDYETDGCEDEDEEDEPSNAESPRQFTKYTVEQMESIVRMFFDQHWKFETIQKLYKKLSSRAEIYR